MSKEELESIKNHLSNPPGILGKEEYFNSAVIMPLVRNNGELCFLFEKRAEHIRQGGEVCFPGGEFDLDQDSDPVETAVRETIEEIGIEKSKIHVLGRFDTFVGPMGVTVDPVVALLDIDSLASLNIDHNEVEKVFLVPVSFFFKNEPKIFHIRVEAKPYYINERGEKVVLLPVKELNLPERYSKPWIEKNQPVYVYETDEGVVWGITAVLIKAFVKKFGNVLF